MLTLDLIDGVVPTSDETCGNVEVNCLNIYLYTYVYMYAYSFHDVGKYSSIEEVTRLMITTKTRMSCFL